MFSRRAQWNAPENRLTEARRAHAGELLDLTESNPTRAAIHYPLDEIAEAFARAARAPYDPDPRGLRSAREAVAAHLGCDADELLLTASTSEAYSFLFKLLTDPGDAIATATPSYPLLEHLASLEQVTQKTFALEYHRRWELDVSRIPRDVKAVVVINPNNPTGSYVSPAEQAALQNVGIPIISDEVFHDYPLESDPAPSFGDFVLGGLSKSCGLPHLKLGWIRTRDQKALDALELIADNFLSVSTPVQAALPDLLRLGSVVRDAIRARTRENLDVLTRAVETVPSARLLPVEGGWSAVIRVPSVESDEDLALRLLQEQHVLIHPGYFFDFDRDGYVVVSLLTRPDVFAEGITRLTMSLPR